MSNFLCAVPSSPWHVNPVPQFLLLSCLERRGLLGEAFQGSLSCWVSAGKVCCRTGREAQCQGYILCPHSCFWTPGLHLCYVWRRLCCSSSGVCWSSLPFHTCLSHRWGLFSLKCVPRGRGSQRLSFLPQVHFPIWPHLPSHALMCWRPLLDFKMTARRMRATSAFIWGVFIRAQMKKLDPYDLLSSCCAPEGAGLVCVGSRLCRLPCAAWCIAARTDFCWTLPQPWCRHQDFCPADLTLWLMQKHKWDFYGRIILQGGCVLESMYRQVVSPPQNYSSRWSNFSTTVLCPDTKSRVGMREAGSWSHWCLLGSHSVPCMSHYKADRIWVFPASDSATPSGVTESVC